MKYLIAFEKYEKVNKEERDEFINYMLDYYGPDGTWSEFFNGKLNRKVLLKYTSKFIEARKKVGLWSDGDSFDRETFRDVMLLKLGIENNSGFDLNPYITDLEKDTEKYNL